MINVVHLTDSPFFGGPERQILGLSLSLSDRFRTTVVCFRDGGSCLPFVDRLTQAGIATDILEHTNPHYAAMIADVVRILRSRRAGILLCHGYKADMLGLIAARYLSLPVISVSRGWTGHMWRVRLYEALDRRALRRFDSVICVSDGQAAKVRLAGVRPDRVRVIRNAIDATRFPSQPDERGRRTLRELFTLQPDAIVMAIGRLSPEKGFDRLVEAAKVVLTQRPTVGFVLVGDGPQRAKLEDQIRASGIADRFVLTGFRSDVDSLLPHADVVVQSSYTEGLPNVLLEASAAGVPIVATAVGGTQEVVQDGENGHLVDAGDVLALASRIVQLIDSTDTRRAMGRRGREIVSDAFGFAHQSAQYESLFGELLQASRDHGSKVERSFVYAAPTGESPASGLDSDSAVRA
ncbi:MAG TPA: glycosyltransferase [Gemmatimonadaceae bacterium]|jgi:glycosyltransferase involved in cell wall biosynthesis